MLIVDRLLLVLVSWFSMGLDGRQIESCTLLSQWIMAISEMLSLSNGCKNMSGDLRAIYRPVELCNAVFVVELYNSVCVSRCLVFDDDEAVVTVVVSDAEDLFAAV